MSTGTARALGVGIVAAALVAAAPSAAADTDWNASPPQDVVDSLAVGGAAAEEADSLAGYIPGEPAPSRTIEYTYGPPIRVLIWNQEPWSTNDAEAFTNDRLTALDISEIVGERWLAVQYADGEPVSTLEVDEHGNFIVLGNYIESDVQILADLARGSLVLGASMPGETDEFYLVSYDHRSVTAINEPAREFLKQESLGAAEFRALRQTRLAEFIAAQPTDLPEDAIGGGAVFPGLQDNSLRLHSSLPSVPLPWARPHCSAEGLCSGRIAPGAGQPTIHRCESPSGQRLCTDLLEHQTPPNVQHRPGAMCMRPAVADDLVLAILSHAPSRTEPASHLTAPAAAAALSHNRDQRRDPGPPPAISPDGQASTSPSQGTDHIDQLRSW